VPRALAAFVKRPQAALLKSALETFYKMASMLGQTNVLIYFIVYTSILFYTVQRRMAAIIFPGRR
jgi:hypothetical protein